MMVSHTYIHMPPLRKVQNIGIMYVQIILEENLALQSSAVRFRSFTVCGFVTQSRLAATSNFECECIKFLSKPRGVSYP